MDRLGQVTTPTLVLAGRDDFVFPRSASGSWPPGSPGAGLRIIERAGHNAHSEQPDEALQAVSDFIAGDVAASLHRPDSVHDGQGVKIAEQYLP
jgi:proline iminopeptidase